MIVERILSPKGDLVALAGACTYEDAARYYRGLDAATQTAIRQSTDPAAMQVYGSLCDHADETALKAYCDSKVREAFEYPNGCPVLPESDE